MGEQLIPFVRDSFANITVPKMHLLGRILKSILLLFSRIESWKIFSTTQRNFTVYV